MTIITAVTAAAAVIGAGTVALWPAGAARPAQAPANLVRASTQASASGDTSLSDVKRVHAAALEAASIRAIRLELTAEQARQAAERRAAATAAQAAAAQAAAQQQAQAPSSSPSGSPAGPSGSPQQIASAMLASFGWGQDQFGCLDSLWTRESGWSVTAENPDGAYGIPQALPGSKMASAGPDWQTNAATQIRWGLGYIQGLYGSPCAAWSHEQATGWY